MTVASDDIIASWHARSVAEIGSNDPERVDRGAQRLFWLSRGLFSGALGSGLTPTALEWLLLSATAGSIDAKASVYNVFCALEQVFPIDSLADWLLDACYAGQESAERDLKELFPDLYPGALECLRTTYCGYGQDCFGERWRNEYPLDSIDDTLEAWLEDGRSLDELHNYPGLACGMAWLHYASSYGRLDVVEFLVRKGADPKIINDYGETPLFMACQSGHFDVVRFLCPLTRNGSDKHEALAADELQFLGRFDPTKTKEAANLLVDWGANINQPNSDKQQTPLAYILNQHGPNCMDAVSALLASGADPLIKDYHGLDSLAHAACQLSFHLVQVILRYIPVESMAQCKAEALWFVLEMDNYDVFVNGGKHHVDKLEGTIKLLLNNDTCRLFRVITGHSVFVFSCAKAPLAVVRCLFNLIPECSLNEWSPSAEEWYTPLMAAVVRRRVDVVLYLLELNTDPGLTHPTTLWTPLFYAVSGSPKIVSALVRSVEMTQSWEAACHYINQRDMGGFTAFEVAVAGEFFEAADILANYQPDFLTFAIPYEDDSTCLLNFLGLAVDKADQLLYLLDLIGPAADLPRVDNEEVTVLHAVAGLPIGE
ncbi:ankyrin repeat-containing domain protein [Ilyonectria sp. MPI-CAGE-AT-0026]|nr:ankyrin repeat-containing domain protein [Ilyonectria sp. MPI-CAGE-AT-0026]